jgi:hypothetical protein
MSWICKFCETINENEQNKKCEVCNALNPMYITKLEKIVADGYLERKAKKEPIITTIESIKIKKEIAKTSDKKKSIKGKFLLFISSNKKSIICAIIGGIVYLVVGTVVGMAIGASIVIGGIIGGLVGAGIGVLLGVLLITEASIVTIIGVIIGGVIGAGIGGTISGSLVGTVIGVGIGCLGIGMIIQGFIGSIDRCKERIIGEIIGTLVGGVIGVIIGAIIAGEKGASIGAGIGAGIGEGIGESSLLFGILLGIVSCFIVGCGGLIGVFFQFILKEGIGRTSVGILVGVCSSAVIWGFDWNNPAI